MSKRSLASFFMVSFFWGGAAIAAAKCEIPQTAVMQALKGQILQLAIQNIDNVATQPSVRGQLESLTADLVSHSPALTQAQIEACSPGSWQQVWSDEKDMTPPGGPQRNLRQVYQYVSTSGWGMNFGERLTVSGSLTFALEAAAALSGVEQTTEITKAFLRNSGMVVGESIAELSNAIFLGQSDSFVQREAGRFPKGPIGAKGVLTLLYVDQDLKIGRTPNVYDGKIEMFIMQRTDSVRNL
jgi:hypothetical protein